MVDVDERQHHDHDDGDQRDASGDAYPQRAMFATSCLSVKIG
jgi:hypothetical protein